jgi:uncharacterized protein YbjT (DUF2867 family)
MRTALIVGASGLVGKACLYQLLEQDAYSRITALVRKPLAVKHPRLHQVVVNFDHLEESRSEVVGDDVFCCLGTTIRVAGSQENFRKVDCEYPLAVATIAFENGASQFLVISSMGADPSSAFFYNRVKGELEKALKTLAYSSVHIFRPSLLLGNRKAFRIGEQVGKVVMRVAGIFLLGPLRKFKAIQDITVAKAMIKVALSDKEGVHIYPNNEILDLGASQ